MARMQTRCPESFRDLEYVMVASPMKMTTVIFHPKLRYRYYNLG